MIVTLDTLEYLARTSRIPQVAAFVGGLLSIKPIVEMSGGDIHLLARVRTRRRSIEELFACMQKAIPATARVHVAVQHASAPEEAVALEERVHRAFTCAELFTTEFDQTACPSCRSLAVSGGVRTTRATRAPSSASTRKRCPVGRMTSSPTWGMRP